MVDPSGMDQDLASISHIKVLISRVFRTQTPRYYFINLRPLVVASGQEDRVDCIARRQDISHLGTFVYDYFNQVRVACHHFFF